MKLDDTNRRILDLLQEDSSITNAELARRIGLAPASTLERVRWLEHNGIIAKYVAVVDPEKVGMPITAFVEISMSSHSAATIDAFSAAIATIPEVLECHHVAGDKDFVLKVVTPDIRSYEKVVLEKIATMPNIGRITTVFVLSTVKRAGGVPMITE
jgi:DNA-binding Lrp family transcriptional regulator